MITRAEFFSAIKGIVQYCSYGEDLNEMSTVSQRTKDTLNFIYNAISRRIKKHNDFVEVCRRVSMNMTRKEIPGPKKFLDAYSEMSREREGQETRDEYDSGITEESNREYFLKNYKDRACLSSLIRFLNMRYEVNLKSDSAPEDVFQAVKFISKNRGDALKL